MITSYQISINSPLVPFSLQFSVLYTLKIGELSNRDLDRARAKIGAD